MKLWLMVFFTRSKQTFTGAARTVTSEQLLNISPNNVLQALSSIDPSIKINKNNAMGLTLIIYLTL